MPRPSTLTYNELDGEEIKAVLTERFQQILADVPYLQRHITLPRVRMSLMITLEIYADKPNPDVKILQDQIDIHTNAAPTAVLTQTLEVKDTVSTAPGTPHAQPAGQVREDHGLPLPTPVPLRDARGEHIVIVDLPDGGQERVRLDSSGKSPDYQFASRTEEVEGRIVAGIGGTLVDRTGNSSILSAGGVTDDGQPKTAAKIDGGRAGLREHKFNRQNFGLNKRG